MAGKLVRFLRGFTGRYYVDARIMEHGVVYIPSFRFIGDGGRVPDYRVLGRVFGDLSNLPIGSTMRRRISVGGQVDKYGN